MAEEKEEKKGSEKKEPTPRPPKRTDYVCTVPCWHNGHKYKKGQIVSVVSGKELPHHKNKKLAHFEKVGPTTEVPADTGVVNVNAEATSES